MASPIPPPSSVASGGFQKPNKSLNFFANAMKRKDSFIQFFAMTGILLLSVRSLGQKYRIHNLMDDNAALEEEREGLVQRMNHIRQSLLAEAAAEPTGRFASRIRLLFGIMDSNCLECTFNLVKPKQN